MNAAATPAARGPGVWAGESKWTSRAFLRGRLSFAFHPERFYAIDFLLPYLPQCIGIGVGIANAPQHLWLGWVGLGWVGSGRVGLGGVRLRCVGLGVLVPGPAYIRFIAFLHDGGHVLRRVPCHCIIPSARDACSLCWAAPCIIR